jgi:anti-sigma factor RsiW
MSAARHDPVGFETLVAYWAGDLPPAETDAVDAHVMSCAACAAASERVAIITEGVRATVSPVITARELGALRARGLRIEENPMRPGQRTPVVFGADLDLLIHRLGGLDLARAERVQVTVRVEDSGEVLLQNPAAPFDAGAGEVIIACQRHFSVFPSNIVVEVAVREPGGSETSATYTIPHRFERPDDRRAPPLPPR